LKEVNVPFKLAFELSSVDSYTTLRPKASACSSKPKGISRSSMSQINNSSILPPTYTVAEKYIDTSDFGGLIPLAG
jgi:hypothetical protein